MQNGRFPGKSADCLKKLCYKVSLCEKYHRQCCKAFIGLSIRAKMIGGGRPLQRENLVDTDPPPCKTRIFARRASAVTASGKSLYIINTNRRSTTHFPITLRIQGIIHTPIGGVHGCLPPPPKFSGHLQDQTPTRGVQALRPL